MLNEFDHWVINQWEEFKTDRIYDNKSGNAKSNTRRVLRKSKLKQMFYVRYADDFRILYPTSSRQKEYSKQ